MTEETSTPPRTSYSWSETWIKALTQPAVETYESIVNDPQAGVQRALFWVALAALIAYAVSSLLGLVFGSPFGYLPLLEEDTTDLLATRTTGVGTLLCGALGAVVGAVLVLIVIVALVNLVAKALGGSGAFDRLIYAWAAIAAPVSLISSVLASIPFVNCVTPLLGIYVIVLEVIAVKATHRFGWGSAIAATLLVPVGIVLLLTCVVVALLVVLGPVIGNVFSNIVEGLQ
jgi:hypothetical protein